jgi:hypothetical protein
VARSDAVIAAGEVALTSRPDVSDGTMRAGARPVTGMLSRRHRFRTEASLLLRSRN